MNDLRFAIRQLLKAPGFTVVAVLTLALGIGATTAIFSIINAVLLRPLPYRDSERLVRVYETLPARNIDRVPVAPPNYFDWRDQAKAFAALAAHQWSDVNLTGHKEARRLHGSRVTANFFSVLGISPLIGRVFTPDEEPRGKHFVVVIAHAMWLRDFGGDVSVLGRSLTLDGENFTVIGVMPPDLRYPGAHVEFWMPAAFHENELKERGNHGWGVIGRLKPGASPEQAKAEVTAIAARTAQVDPDSSGFSATVVRLQDDLVGDKRTPLLVLLGAVGCVLAIACANVANLMLARASARQKEFAIRSAIGAGRARLVRQLLSESLLLASIGGTIGVLLAIWGVAACRSLPGGLLPRADEIHVSIPVLLFAVAITMGTGLLFGLVPALRAASSDANEVLKDGGRSGSEGFRRNRYRAALVVSEVALSLVLLAGAGLLLRSFQKLQDVQLGFRAEGVTTANLLLPDRQYPGEQRQAAVFGDIVSRLRVTPGVDAAAAVFGLPQGQMRSRVTFDIEGRPKATPSEGRDACYRQVTSGYFAAMEIPMISGRDFTAMDTTNAPGVVVVNEAFLRRFFPGSARGFIPGTRINLDFGTNTWLQIVGVVGDVRSEGVAQSPDPEIFIPFTQHCWGFASLVVRSSLDSATVGSSIRATVASVDSNLPVDALRPLRSLVDDNLSDRRLYAVLLGSFAALALVLAATGIYGVMAYSVSRRVQEIGIRMALGAQLGDVLRMVMRQGMMLTFIGLVVGLTGGLGAAHLLAALLFEIQPHDPPTFGFVTCLLAAVALLACWIPARRAARVDPIVALRNE